MDQEQMLYRKIMIGIPDGLVIIYFGSAQVMYQRREGVKYEEAG